MEITKDSLYLEQYLYIRHGKEKNAVIFCDKIFDFYNEKRRNREVDRLVDKMEEHSEKNGFFTAKDNVNINLQKGTGFKLDDREVYYNFFTNLKEIIESHPRYTINGSISCAIRQTLLEYFNGRGQDVPNRDAVWGKLKRDENENIIMDSIKGIKGKGMAMCSEYASLSHNLWLLTGRESFFVSTYATKFENFREGHAYNIVNLEDKFILYDIANDKLENFKKNPIDDILQCKDFKVGDDYYFDSKKYMKDMGLETDKAKEE